MQAQKAAELFQTMAIINLNMGNLNLEVNNMNNKLAIGEKEKAIQHEELDRERDFQKGYKHNVEIQRRNRVKAKHKFKMCIKKLQDQNEELKGSTTQLKSQDVQVLKQEVEIWETTKKKWIEALFLRKQQHEALGNHVKTLTKENKEKENVLTYLVLVNLKNVSLLQFEEFRRNTIEIKRKK